MQSDDNIPVPELTIQQLVAFDQILNALPVACCLLDSSSKITFINRRIEQLLNIEKQNIIGKNIAEVFSGCIDIEGHQIIAEALLYKRAGSCNYALSFSGQGIRLEATPVDSGVLLSFIEFSAGDPAYGSLQIRRAEQESREHEELLNSIFDTSLICISVLRAVRSEQGTILDFLIIIVNKETERETGRTDLVGKLHSQEFPGIKKAGLFDIMLNVMKTGEPEGTEYYYPYEGFKKWFSCMFVKMDDGLVATHLDITTQKLAEKESRDDAMFIRGIADAVPDMSYMIDIKRMQMIYANNHIVKLFDRNLVEIKALGSSFFDEIIYPEDRQIFDDNIAALRHATDQDVLELTYRLVDARMNMHWIKTKRTVFKRDENGLPTHIVGVSENITEQMELKESVLQFKKERKKLELQRQQEVFKSTLITQEEERKRIAESLHNNLGQLLYGIKLSLNQIKLNRGEQSNENELVYQQSVNLLTEAINESRRISHELTPAILESFGLKVAIEDICQRFEPKIRFDNIFAGLYRRLDTYLEIAVYRIVQELILNMVKHAEATKASIKIEADKRSIKIHVEDNGKGFDITTSKGWGIGLKTIQNRVKLLNGKFKTLAHPGTGTVVDIFIPNSKLTG